jgi:hypothetical protein
VLNVRYIENESSANWVVFRYLRRWIFGYSNTNTNTTITAAATTNNKTIKCPILRTNSAATGASYRVSRIIQIKIKRKLYTSAGQTRTLYEYNVVLSRYRTIELYNGTSIILYGAECNKTTVGNWQLTKD